MTVLELPLPAGNLMPQANRMLLLDALTFCADGQAVGQTRIRPDHLFLDSHGRLDAAAGVESLAQLAAATKGYETKQSGGDIRFGYLVGVKNFIFHETIRRGDDLTLKTRRVFEMDAVSIVEGEIFRGADCLVTGTLKLYETNALPPHPQHAAHQASIAAGEKNTAALFPAERSPIHRALLENLADFSIKPSASGNKKAPAATGGFHLDDTFAGFDGHFPGYPLLPGVVTLQMGLALAECAAGQPLEFAVIEQAKFLQPAYPHETLEGEVRVSPSEDHLWSVSVKTRRQGQPVAGFSFLARMPLEIGK